MASSYGTNPIYIDSAVDGLSYTGLARVQCIRWDSYSDATYDIAADDDFLLVDRHNHKIAGKRDDAGNVGGEWNFPFGFPVDGISVTALDGGVCYIYLI